MQESLSQLEKNLNEIQSAVELVKQAGDTSDEVINGMKDSQKEYINILNEIKSQFATLQKESKKIAERNKELQQTVNDFKERNSEIQKRIQELNLEVEIEKVENAIGSESKTIQHAIGKLVEQVKKINDRQEKIYEDNRQRIDSTLDSTKHIERGVGDIKGSINQFQSDTKEELGNLNKTLERITNSNINIQKNQKMNRIIVSIGFGLTLAAVLLNAFGFI